MKSKQKGIILSIASLPIGLLIHTILFMLDISMSIEIVLGTVITLNTLALMLFFDKQQ